MATEAVANGGPPTFEERMTARMVSAHESQVRAAISFLDQRGWWGGGGYDAAGYGDKALQEDHPWADSAKSAIVPGLWNLRSRCRNIARNSPFAAGCIGRIKSGVTGVRGLTPQPAPDPERLGVPVSSVESFTRAVGDAWDMWTQPSGGADDREERSFGSLQRTAMEEVLSGGDVLVVHRNRPGRVGIPFGTSLQLIEPERVSNPNEHPATTRFAAGVELDAMGRVIRYHVNRTHPGESGWRNEWDPVAARSDRGQRMARLLYPPGREGEIRGVPILAPSYITLRKLADYLDAEGYRALTQSLFTAFVKKVDPTGREAGVRVRTDGGADYGAAVLAESQDMRLGHGSIERLLPGEEIQFPRATAPNSDVGPWTEVVERHIGMSFGVAYEALVMRYDSSYSASRGAVEETWQTFRTWRHWLVEHFCQPAYDAFLAELIASGEVNAPGFFTDPMMRFKWTRADWVGSPPPMLDPVKAATAATLRIREALSNRKREAMELTGTEVRSNLRELAEEQRLMIEAGLKMDPADMDPPGGNGGNGNGNDDGKGKGKRDE